MDIFPGGPWLAGTRMSPFWILLELIVMKVVVASGAINRRAKLQSNRYYQQTNTQLFTCRMPLLSPKNSVSLQFTMTSQLKNGSGPVLSIFQRSKL